MAVGAFTAGQYGEAYWQFETLEVDYGEEPEYLDPDFQRILHPVRGYAALMADRPTDALVEFTELLRQPDLSPGLRAFALYNAAIAQAQTQALSLAAHSFRSFQESFPNTREAGLALLQEAELCYEIGETDVALERLNGFYRSDAPATLRMQGRLRALQIAGESGRTELVQELLFTTDWQVSQMPDIAILTFAAIDAGDLLLGASQPEQAIRAYRLALPRESLLKQQAQRLQATRRLAEEEGVFASSIWKSHIRQLIGRLERQQSRLEQMEDYTPSLYLRSGQAYLLAGRHREARLLFREIAQDEAYTSEIRAEAHYRWTLALCEAEQWAKARETAHGFLEAHPGHALANAALFLIARAYQAEGRYSDAIAVLDELIVNFPKDKQAPRWYFTRGYNLCSLERPAEARECFETALASYPKSELHTQLALWSGLTWFFEKDYATALKQLERLREKSRKHPLYPEIQYRIANLHYALRDYKAAIRRADKLIKTFPDHHRVPEAQALRGDSLMGQGELIQAAAAFRQVPADDAQLYDYAVFQCAKIYRALERYDLLRTQLQSYVDREDAASRPRVSEALYWIGWSLQQEGRASEAFPLYEAALQRFGNRPEARAVGSILSAYATLYRRNPDISSGFDRWLQDTSEQSLQTVELTWYARLTRFQAKRLEKSAGKASAEAAMLNIHRLVPIEQQDVACLAEIGILLAERGYDSADDYFEQILTCYPKRFERAAAYYGKARLAAKNSHLTQAQRWLARFLEETPTHPLAADARLLAADLFVREGRYALARTALDEVLQIKEMRGRPHARALATLARIESETGAPKRAIAYWQRIYTLYRAYPELLAPAYWQSALLFEELGDAVAARNTLKEMLADPRLKQDPLFEKAAAKLPALQAAAASQSELAEHAPPTKELAP